MEHDNMIIKSFKASLSESEEGVKQLKGYASMFGNIDSHGDIVMPGAFAKSVVDHQARNIKLFSSHSMDARDLLGSVTVLREDERGLYFEADLSQSPSAQDILIKAKEGHLDEVSIGFFLTDSEFVKNEANEPIRLIKEVELIEISLVSRASNPKAKVLVVKNDELNKNNPTKGEDTMTEERKENTQEEKFEKLMSSLNDKIEKLEKALDAPVNKTYEVVEEVKEERSTKEMKDEAAALFCDYLTKQISEKQYRAAIEEKALSSVVVEDGGALVPVRLWDKIVEQKDRLNKLEARCTKIVGNGPLDILDFNFSPTWATHDDGGTISETSISGIMGKSTLDPQDYALLFTIPKRLQRRAMESVEDLLARRAAFEFRKLKDDKIMTGTGHKEPLGIITFIDDASATTNTITVTALANLDLTALVSCLYLMEEQYRENAVWLMHPDAIAELRKVETSGGNMLLQPLPGADGIEMRVLGLPLVESQALEDGNASGETMIVLADMSQYYLLEEKAFGVDVSDERYFEKNQVALRMVVAFDGMPVDTKAFKRIAIA